MGAKILKFIGAISASLIATSCSLFATKTYNWMVATKDNTVINYALLIGQNEHSDSIERTRSTRDALNTRDPETEVNNNANLGRPKQGQIDLGGEFIYKGNSYDLPSKIFTVNEIEHMEQKSLAGVVWDTITANSTTATWISKYGKNLTMLISNNDGMAEGAIMASNWIDGLPIFSYDANTSTLKLVKANRIMGTVDQNASAQTSGAYLLIRNILDDLNDTDANKAISKIGTKDYDPTWRGFNGDQNTTPYGAYVNGWMRARVTEETFQEGLDDPHNIEPTFGRAYPDAKWNLQLDGEGPHEILSKSFAIDSSNVSDYIDSNTGEVKTATDLAWNYFTKPTQELPRPLGRKYHICHVYNNIAEVYLQGTMHDYFSIYAGDNISGKEGVLDLDVEKIDGDGIDEKEIFNKVSSASQANPFDAYLINMVTTTDGGTFISELAPKAAMNEGKSADLQAHPKGWDNWEDRLNTPVVFWNRQPQKLNGETDTETMNNKFFKYTYYVGVDAAYGGEEQGKMIVNNLKLRYAKSIGVINEDA